MFAIQSKDIWLNFGRKLCQKATQNVEKVVKSSNNHLSLPTTTAIPEKYKQIMEDLPVAHKYRRYPGAGIRNVITPSHKLVDAALKLFDKYPVNDITEEAKKLRQHLWAKQVPAESDEVRRLGQELEHKLTSLKLQQVGNEELLDEERLEQDMVGIRKTALAAMKRSIYNWRPIKLDAYQSVVYMSSHLLSNFAIWYSIMNEISVIDPEFRPTSMLDFGSGLATSVWAVNDIWKSVEEHFCWDHSVDVCTLARLLLQGGKADADMAFPGIFFRQGLEKQYTKSTPMFDMVVSGHTLLDLPDKETRLKHIKTLWTRTKDYLILVENGTLNGHSLIEEARMYIINNFKEEHYGHVFAPCAHEQPCPLARGRVRPCNFEAKFKSVNLPPRGKPVFLETITANKKEGSNVRYSYVVFKKGNAKGDSRFPRVISPRKHGQKPVTCNMCFPDGKLRHIHFIKKYFPPAVVQVAKSSVWGTRLPITGWEETGEAVEKSDSTTVEDGNHIDSTEVGYSDYIDSIETEDTGSADSVADKDVDYSDNNRLH